MEETVARNGGHSTRPSPLTDTAAGDTSLRGGVLGHPEGDDIPPRATTPIEPRVVLAAFDDDGIAVYQAFAPVIADEACERGRFGPHFLRTRMTWIKPSFGWMLSRSGYATLPGQERVLRITLAHEGFLRILADAVPSSWDPRLFPNVDAWRAAMGRSEVRYQWDPDRDLRLERLPRRALQVGIRGTMIQQYVESWTRRIEDVTTLAHAVGAAVRARETLPAVAGERPYPLPEEIVSRLGMQGSEGPVPSRGGAADRGHPQDRGSR